MRTSFNGISRFRRPLDEVPVAMRMKVIPAELGGMPLPVRWAIVGSASAGAIGAIVGLVVGLLAYAPTAWFALFELGVPATIAGGVVGLVAALIVTAGRRIRRTGRPRKRKPRVARA